MRDMYSLEDLAKMGNPDFIIADTHFFGGKAMKPIPRENKFLVTLRPDNQIDFRVFIHIMSRQDALNFAGWLVKTAQGENAPEEFISFLDDIKVKEPNK